MNTGRHYELTNETIKFDGHILHRIRCTKEFRSILKGTLGGFIEGYGNLEDDAWVGDEAKVYDSAVVNRYASVVGHACVSCSACISGMAVVMDSASVSGCNTFVGDYARISGSAIIRSDITHSVAIRGSANISGNAVIESNLDYIVFKNWWSSGRYFTWTRSNDMWAAGCFYGTGKELIAKAYKDSYFSGLEYERVVKYVEQIKGGSKPSLWRRILLYLKQLYK